MMTTTTRQVTLTVVLHDPFGTVIGRGDITVQPDTYLDESRSEQELTTMQTAMKIGRYVQADAPNPNMPFWLRLSPAN